MSLTPEGRVKSVIKKLLHEFAEMYYHMPVQNGMGKPTLDFVCCYKGRYFAIEAKAPGNHLTLRQEHTKSEIEFALGHVFVIEGDHGMQELRDWLEELKCQ